MGVKYHPRNARIILLLKNKKSTLFVGGFLSALFLENIFMQCFIPFMDM